MTTRLVLLHSPLLGPLSWRRVAAILAGRGAAAEAPAWPRLSTLGADGYAALANSMAASLGAGPPAIVVAHSGAGALMPSVAALARGQVRGVIYCDAILPHPGLSWFDTAPPALAAQLLAGAVEGRLPAWDQWWPPGALAKLVPDTDLREALIGELEPIPVGYFEELAPELELAVPAAYLQLSGAYVEEAQISMRRGWPVVRLPLHHLAMLTHAEAVAGAIESLAARLEGRDG
ncbi:MAG: hypothetical protein JNK30_12955 [Phenylobacterium sp.]|uniref:hypothetical protein n=1 Tax=Phenylobacterium sp. TaxID=1871053 RepID=UPI001A3D5264|nr:hypothetical protein [Phenylobacterium sp.]MBL8772283.1 hypothetical protein [Phenylobacterium sp.]